MNPHVYIELDVADEQGGSKHWLIECANPGILNRVGWKWNMIHEGDALSVIVSPLRTGEPGALLKAVRLPDGTVFSNGGPAGPARIAGLRREAERRGLDPNVWFDHVEQVAAEQIGQETVRYVGNIFKYYVAYQLVVEEQQEREHARQALPAS